jgi:hypothetical protein
MKNNFKKIDWNRTRWQNTLNPMEELDDELAKPRIHPGPDEYA